MFSLERSDQSSWCFIVAKRSYQALNIASCNPTWDINGATESIIITIITIKNRRESVNVIALCSFLLSVSLYYYERMMETIQGDRN